MTDKNDSIGTGSQKILQPLNTLDIKMVSGLIQQKHVRTTEQQLRKFNAHAPSAGKFSCGTLKVRPAEPQSQKGTFDFRLIIRSPHHQETVIFMCETVYQLMILFRIVIRSFCQFPIHPLQFIPEPEQFFKGQFRLLPHRTVVGKNHHLRQVTDRHVFRNRNRPACRQLQACQYFQHSRFTRTVLTDQRNAVLLIYYITDILKKRCRIKFY